MPVALQVFDLVDGTISGDLHLYVATLLAEDHKGAPGKVGEVTVKHLGQHALAAVDRKTALHTHLHVLLQLSRLETDIQEFHLLSFLHCLTSLHLSYMIKLMI